MIAHPFGFAWIKKPAPKATLVRYHYQDINIILLNEALQGFVKTFTGKMGGTQRILLIIRL